MSLVVQRNFNYLKKKDIANLKFEFHNPSFSIISM